MQVYAHATAFTERRDGILFFCAVARGGLHGDEMILAAVAADRRAKVVRARLKPIGDVPRILRTILRGTRCDFAVDSFAPGPLPTNVPGRHAPSWSRGEARLVLDLAHLADANPAVAELVASVDMRALKLAARCRFGTADAYDLLASRPDAARDVVDAVRRHPWLVRGMPVRTLVETSVEAKDSGSDLYGAGGDNAARRFLSDGSWTAGRWDEDRDLGWAPTPAVVRRIAGVEDETLLSRNHLRFLSALPPDWLPEPGSEAWSVTGSLCRLAIDMHCTDPSDVRPLLAGIGGDFVGLSVRVARTAGAADDRNSRLCAVRDAVGRIGDATNALRRDVVAPSLRHAGVRAGDREAIRVARTLLGMAGFLSSFETAQRWHAQERAIRSACTPSDARTWKAPIPAWRAPNRLDVVPLVSASELDAEGVDGTDDDGVPGLSHCVGTRADDCATGRSRIYSVRRSAGRSFERLSTFEIRIGAGDPRVVEHRGRRNADPPKPAAEAVAAWSAAVADSRIPLSREAMLPTGAFHDSARTDPERLRLSVPAWSGLLKRRYRHLDPDDMALAVLGILEGD